jgi:hypothetical protein
MFNPRLLNINYQQNPSLCQSPRSVKTQAKSPSFDGLQITKLSPHFSEFRLVKFQFLSHIWQVLFITGCWWNPYIFIMHIFWDFSITIQLPMGTFRKPRTAPQFSKAQVVPQLIRWNLGELLLQRPNAAGMPGCATVAFLYQK